MRGAYRRIPVISMDSMRLSVSGPGVENHAVGGAAGQPLPRAQDKRRGMPRRHHAAIVHHRIME